MQKVDFDNGRISRNILQTTLPMLVAQLLNLLYSIVDRIYIGRIPEAGTLALGAVGLCFPVVILITGFTNLYGMGGAPLFAMELGRGDREGAAACQNTAFRLLLVTAAVLTVLGEVFSEPLLELFGATATEMPHALPYLRIYLLGTVFSMLAAGMNPFINAQGYSTLGMLTVVVGAAANLVLDPLFIFGFGMGVCGAAIATVLSQGLSMLAVLGFLQSGKNQFPVRFRVSFPKAGQIVGLGMVSFIMSVTNSLVSVTCNSVLMDCGGSLYVSVMTIVSGVRQVVCTPVEAISEGTSPIISYNYGARRQENVRKAVRIMTGLSIGYTALMWGAVMLFPQIFISIFNTDEAILTSAVPALHLYFYTFVFQALQYSGQTVFKSLNKKKQAIFFSLFRKAILVVPLTYMFAYPLGMGTDGVFLAEPVSNLIGGVACYITMWFTVDRKLGREQDI